MSSVTKSGNATHDAACLAALTTLQGAVPGASSQAAVNALYITYYKACLASAVANGCGTETFRAALRSLAVEA